LSSSSSWISKSVTFLAFGNSTPEVMTAIIAVFVFGMYHNELSEKLGGSGGYIAVTTLIGSAMYVHHCEVSSTKMRVRMKHLNKQTFLIYFVSIWWIW
jgi:Ca2+/Na+ antiporter